MTEPTNDPCKTASLHSSTRSHRVKIALKARDRRRRLKRLKETTTEESDDKDTTRPNPAPQQPILLATQMASRYQCSLSSSKPYEGANMDPPPTSSVSVKVPINNDDNTHSGCINNKMADLLLSVDTPSLSAQEVCDATNFTSIQFCCSEVGEVEMLVDGDADSLDDTKVFMNDVWNTPRKDDEDADIFRYEEAVGGVGLLTAEKMGRAGRLIRDKDEDYLKKGVDIHRYSPTSVANASGLTFFLENPVLSCGSERKDLMFSPSNGNSNNESHDIHNKISSRMIQPSSQLKELLSQINRDKESIPQLHRTYITRRKNACGALKLLTSKPDNCLKICWTVGVLDAMSSVLCDTNVTNADAYSVSVNLEARNRIVSALVNLSVHKQNRLLISHHKGLISSLLACMRSDEGEARQGCCTVLFHLAKTNETRLFLIECPGLIETLSHVIDVPKNETDLNAIISIEKEYQNRLLKRFQQPQNVGVLGGIMIDMEAYPPRSLSNVVEDQSLSMSSVSSGSSEGSMEDIGSTHDSSGSEFEADESSCDEENQEFKEPQNVGVLGGIMIDMEAYLPRSLSNVVEDQSLSMSSVSSGSSEGSMEDIGSTHDSSGSESEEDESSCDEENQEFEEPQNVGVLGGIMINMEAYLPRSLLNDVEDQSLSMSSGSSEGSMEDIGSTHDSSGSESEEDESSCEVENILDEMLSIEICIKMPKNIVDEGQHKIDYDADENMFLHEARLCVFACLLCLAENEETAFVIAREETLVEALINVSKMYTSPLHTRAISILAHLARSTRNCHHLVFNYVQLLPMLQNAIISENADTRKHSLYAIQNLSIDKSCRAPIAHTPTIIASLTDRCNSESEEEVIAAVASLHNLSDEPANLIQFISANNCIGTMIGIANSEMIDDDERHLVQFMAKDILATISFWFRKIATSGAQKISGDTTPATTMPLHDAVLKPTTFCQWS